MKTRTKAKKDPKTKTQLAQNCNLTVLHALFKTLSELYGFTPVHSQGEAPAWNQLLATPLLLLNS